MTTIKEPLANAITFTATSNTIGTGNLVLNEDLSSTLNGNTTYEVTITNDRDFGARSGEFEFGYVTYDDVTNTLIRQNINVLKSSNNNDLVNFSLGSKTIIGVEQQVAVDATELTINSIILDGEKLVGVAIGDIITTLDSSVKTGFIELDGATITGGVALYPTIATRYSWMVSGSNLILPDFRGRVLRSWDHGAAVDPDAASRTARAGDSQTGDYPGTYQDYTVEEHLHAHAHTHSGGSYYAPTHRHYTQAGYINANNLSGGGSNARIGVHAVYSNYSGAIYTAGTSGGASVTNTDNYGGNETRMKNINVFHQMRVV